MLLLHRMMHELLHKRHRSKSHPYLSTYALTMLIERGVRIDLPVGVIVYGQRAMANLDVVHLHADDADLDIRRATPPRKFDLLVNLALLLGGAIFTLCGRPRLTSCTAVLVDPPRSHDIPGGISPEAVDHPREAHDSVHLHQEVGHDAVV
jgi:hypothetical protein